MSSPTATPARAAHGSDIDRLAIDTIRTLSMDAVEAAKSGHPGTPMALAPVAYTVWKDFLRYDPAAPTGPTATASCSPAAMPRCCSIRSFIWPGSGGARGATSRPYRSTRSGSSVNSTASVPGTPSIT
jgi:hypothetical protein